MMDTEDVKIITLEYVDDISRDVMLEYLDIALLERYSGFQGADIKALLKRHIGPIFILGVDGRVVILSYRKGLVKIHIDSNGEDIVLRRRTTLFDKPIDSEVAYRIIVAIATLTHIVEQKENNNV